MLPRRRIDIITLTFSRHRQRARCDDTGQFIAYSAMRSGYVRDWQSVTCFRRLLTLVRCVFLIRAYIFDTGFAQ